MTTSAGFSQLLSSNTNREPSANVTLLSPDLNAGETTISLPADLERDSATMAMFPATSALSLTSGLKCLRRKSFNGPETFRVHHDGPASFLSDVRLCCRVRVKP